MGCLACFKSLKKSKKKKRRRMCCFGGGSSDEEPLKKGGKCGMCCFNCNGSSKAEDLSRKERKGSLCCFKSSKNEISRKNGSQDEQSSNRRCTKDIIKNIPGAGEIIRLGNENIAARMFTYRDLSAATKNFSTECLLGEGSLGKVYKGNLKGANEVIAVKQLHKNESQGNREFLIEVLMLSLLSHPNLVNLLGYCVDGDERILVYDYMPLGSLQDHLLDLSPNKKPLDWHTRMKIAVGAAKGLEHLHDTVSPPVIFRDLKASNILLDNDYDPKLSDFGLAKLGPVGAENHIATRVMGNYGYCAPEYALNGKLTTMSDIYSFGVVLLELITGRKAMDSTRPRNEQRLVDWAMPRFKNKKNFAKMADPSLEGNFPVKALNQALAIATMCIQEEDTTRPLIKDVVRVLQFLAVPNEDLPEVEEKEGESENSIDENQVPNEKQKGKSVSESTDEDSLHSSRSDWQSCSTAREEDEELLQQDAAIA